MALSIYKVEADMIQLQCHVPACLPSRHTPWLVYVPAAIKSQPPRRLDTSATTSMAPLQDLHDRYRSFIHRTADKIRLTEHRVISQLIAETLCTALLILYADGAVAQKFLGLQLGYVGQFLSLSVGSGAAVCTCVLVAGKACPALLNPAFATANALVGRLRWSLLPAYILLEFVGAYLGAGLLLAVYNTKIIEYANTFENGQYLTNTTGGIFVAVTTALLVFGIYGITEDRLVKKSPHCFPAFVGLVVFLVVGTYMANASSCLNPARDFGPRLLIFTTCKSN
ncbi:unnamed protein product [Dibothriocephalus latus]|uniref:Aquaporin n=1 Tax=Dibothriocephalus latus TaxID=60516 RepID=A0A3P6S4H1_DIBLA|nr:unnamed protein product [Dibothriocephalus latus]